MLIVPMVDPKLTKINFTKIPQNFCELRYEPNFVCILKSHKNLEPIGIHTVTTLSKEACKQTEYRYTIVYGIIHVQCTSRVR